MSNTYYPSNDEQYKVWLANFVTQLTGNAAQVGLVPADLTPISTALDDFDAALTASNTARIAAKSMINAKFTKRDASEDILKPLVRRICNHPGMTDALRGILGLQREMEPEAATPVSLLTPLVYLEPAAGQVHIHWGRNPQNEGNNGKLPGVKGAVIYRKRAADATYQIVGYATKSPYTDPIVGAGADYVYVVRYRGTSPSDLSNESEPSTIAARGEIAA